MSHFSWGRSSPWRSLWWWRSPHRPSPSARPRMTATSSASHLTPRRATQFTGMKIWWRPTGMNCIKIGLPGKYTVLVLRMAHRIWKETKQEPATAGPGNMLGSCLVSFRFLSAILSTSTVQCLSDIMTITLWQNRPKSGTVTVSKFHFITLELSPYDKYRPVTIFWPCPEVVTISYNYCILRHYYQENMTSRIPFLFLRIDFPGRLIFIQLPPGISPRGRPSLPSTPSPRRRKSSRSSKSLWWSRRSWRSSLSWSQSWRRPRSSKRSSVKSCSRLPFRLVPVLDLVVRVALAPLSWRHSLLVLGVVVALPCHFWRLPPCWQL